MSEIMAFIPARSGSQRVPGKNIRPLAGHPLLAYTVAAAHYSGIFSAIHLVSDSLEYHRIAYDYGYPFIFHLEPAELANGPDIGWLRWVLGDITWPDYFAILRPSSPFRRADTIVRAWHTFQSQPHCDSLRAVESVCQHPGKMWRWGTAQVHIVPYIPQTMIWRDGQPTFNSPTQLLERVFVQNASLEITRTASIVETGTITGHSVVPFWTEGYEGFDINTEEDWLLAEALLAKGLVHLPSLSKS